MYTVSKEPKQTEQSAIVKIMEQVSNVEDFYELNVLPV